MDIEHDSRLELYRAPFGAVPAGTVVRLRLGLRDAGLPRALKLKYSVGETLLEKTLYYVFEAGGCCFYETEVAMPRSPGLVWYYFEADMEDGAAFYGNNAEDSGGKGAVYETAPEHRYQITVYDPAYQTPEWFRKAVVYQIFPDRFYNGAAGFLGNRTDIVIRGWDETPYYKAEQFGGTYLANDFFGGNLRGIMKKLPYLKELGISAIYLNPIFKAYSNHKYDTGDYKEIDPMFGTEEEFRALCEKAGALGIRIILDGVFNHTGSNSRYFNKDGAYDSVGAYQSQDSPYYEWYKFEQWPDQYEAWWGMPTLPHIEEEAPSFQEYILTGADAVVKRWLRLGASGWRLDVVDELPDSFVKTLRREVKRQDPDAVIIGEVWEDASNKISYGVRREYFLGQELDSVMNYPLRDAIVQFAKGEIDARGFDHRIMRLKENYPAPAFYALLNLLSSHDVERILTAVSNAPDKHSITKDVQAAYRIPEEEYPAALDRVKAAVMLQMLLPGVPCVYYGDEAGMQGYADPFCRGTFPWDNINRELLEWHKTAIALRNGAAVFTDGAFETVYKIGGGYAFIRYDAAERYLVMVNFSQEPQWMRIDAARYGVTAIENCLCAEEYASEDGVFYVEVPQNWVKVFKAV